MNTERRPEKGLDEPVLTAADVVRWKLKRGILPRIPPPRSVILCYQSSLISIAIKTYRAKQVKGFMGDLYMLGKENHGIVLIGNFGIGAPAAVAMMEELAAFGARRFISIGMAGALQSHLRSGALVICDRAIRDEGTSRHYLPEEKWATANPELVQALSHTLQTSGQPANVGSSWTTDAPYREMRRQVEQYRQEGVLTVEMESAALFAAGRSLGLSVGAAFAVADTLDGSRWPLDFDQARAQRGLQVLLATAVQVLTEAK
ncbi:MAG: nucleoside phosphorylase [Anaerolineae bacterium]